MAEPELLMTIQPRSLGGRFNSFIVLFFFCLIPIIAQAGGLGMAPLAAIIGGSGWLTATKFKALKPNSTVFVFFGFLIWAAMTALWSPYDSGGLSNPVKLLLGVTIFLGCFSAIRAAYNTRPNQFAHFFLAINIFMCGLIVFDQLSRFGLTFLFDAPKEGEDLFYKKVDAVMNVGHAVTIAALFLGPVIAICLKLFRWGFFCALVYMLLVLCAAHLSALAIGMIAAIAIFIISLAAYKWPVRTSSFAIFTAIASLIFAPLLGVISARLPDDFVQNLPVSWQHRVAMWEYTEARIWDNLFMGHGFDAVRTFEAVTSIGVYDNLPIVSLHPHNAGLHIWVETGLLGVFIACFCLFLLGRHISAQAAKSRYYAAAMSGFILGATIISATTYGVWQHWWWASLILTASIICAIFIKYEPNHP